MITYALKWFADMAFEKKVDLYEAFILDYKNEFNEFVEEAYSEEQSKYE